MTTVYVGHERGGAAAYGQQVNVPNTEGQEAAVARSPSQNARWPSAKGHLIQRAERWFQRQRTTAALQGCRKTWHEGPGHCDGQLGEAGGGPDEVTPAAARRWWQTWQRLDSWTCSKTWTYCISLIALYNLLQIFLPIKKWPADINWLPCCF